MEMLMHGGVKFRRSLPRRRALNHRSRARQLAVVPFATAVPNIEPAACALGIAGANAGLAAECADDRRSGVAVESRAAGLVCRREPAESSP
jgi:hypothetical protein